MRTIRLIWRREWQPTLVFLPEKSMDWGVWQAIVHGFAESATTEHKHTHKHTQDSVQFSSVAESCPTLCNPMYRSTPGLPVHHQLPEFNQTHIHQLVMQSSHLILCRPLLLLPSIFPSISVFSNASVLRIRWPKYWSFISNCQKS